LSNASSRPQDRVLPQHFTASEPKRATDLCTSQLRHVCVHRMKISTEQSFK